MSESSDAPVNPRPERTDAALNRTRLLLAAERLFQTRGIAAVSTEDIAKAAGVGKGTLYRRFGDKAGLAMAVLAMRDTALGDAIRDGKPPLGPGAGPKSRLRAFVGAYAAYLERNQELVVLGETASPGARYRSPAYGTWRDHVQGLLERAKTPQPEASAELIMGVLDAGLYAHLRTARGWSAEAVAASMVAAADAIARRRD